MASIAPQSDPVLGKMLETFKNPSQPSALRASIIQQDVLSRFQQQSASIERVLVGELPAADPTLQESIDVALEQVRRDSPQTPDVAGTATINPELKKPQRREARGE
jgi:hypothetical protein